MFDGGPDGRRRSGLWRRTATLAAAAPAMFAGRGRHVAVRLAATRPLLWRWLRPPERIALRSVHEPVVSMAAVLGPLMHRELGNGPPGGHLGRQFRQRRSNQRAMRRPQVGVTGS